MSSYPEAVRWSADGQAVDLLDQTLLPEREERILLRSAQDVAEAIRSMRVRGAPAIGVAAAMGVAIDAAHRSKLPAPEFQAGIEAALAVLAASRPTAVNLFWALERMNACATTHRARTNGEVACKLYGEASAILAEDREMCRAIGEHGAALMPDRPRVLTHCNAGALATGGMGTALAPLYVLHERGKPVEVFAPETRPALQGSRLTAWELSRAGIPVTVITDSTVASLMRAGLIDVVIVGADRIAANGDVANKIGTYSVAVLARHHGIPFYVAAPRSTFDANCATGGGIPIEERNADEVRRSFGRLTAPGDVAVRAPAFNVTPAELVTAIITDRGVLRPPYTAALAALTAEPVEASA